MRKNHVIVFLIKVKVRSYWVSHVVVTMWWIHYIPVNIPVTFHCIALSIPPDTQYTQSLLKYTGLRHLLTGYFYFSFWESWWVCVMWAVSCLSCHQYCMQYQRDSDQYSMGSLHTTVVNQGALRTWGSARVIDNHNVSSGFALHKNPKRLRCKYWINLSLFCRVDKSEPREPWTLWVYHSALPALEALHSTPVRSTWSIIHHYRNKGTPRTTQSQLPQNKVRSSRSCKSSDLRCFTGWVGGCFLFTKL